MGILCDYFVAATDNDAGAFLDLGPTAPGSGIAPGSVLEAKGIEPAVMLGTLEELLTGRSFEELLDELPQPLVTTDDGERLVIAVSAGLLGALTELTEERAAEVAVPWSQTEEFFGEGDPELLAGFVVALAGLARSARDSGAGVYCWLCI